MNWHDSERAPVLSGDGQATRGGRPRRLELPPDTLRRLGALLKTQWRRYRKDLKRCQKRFSAKAVHDSRVQTRRLLSLVELLGPFLPAGRVGKVERALKRHLDTFDDLRDTQVQLAAVGRMRRAFRAARALHAHLLKREERVTRKTRRAIKGVKTNRLGRLIAASRAAVTRQCKERAAKAANSLLLRSVERSFARTRQLRAGIDPQETATIHRTRVAFKKFRYMLEELADYLALPKRRLLTAMRDYQTMMGDIQDAEVLLEALDKYLLKGKIEAGAANRFRRALLGRRRRLIRKYLQAADRLLEFWPPHPGSGGVAPVPPPQESRPQTLKGRKLWTSTSSGTA